jgi:hypothetical protein
MNKKTKLIPFNYEMYKAGAKAVTRDGREVLEIFYSAITINGFNILALIKGEVRFDYFMLDGKFSSLGERLEDLFLLEELEEITFYVNIYSNWYSQPMIKYWSLEDAIKNRDEDSLGTLKVTYTEEDLIK